MRGTTPRQLGMACFLPDDNHTRRCIIYNCLVIGPAARLQT